MTGSAPARGYSWPPFEVGNSAAETHGAYSVLRIAEEAQVVLDELAAIAPAWLASVDRFAMESWATAEARCRRFRRFLAKEGDYDEKGNPRPALADLLRWERKASDERKRLGFDPTARAQLARDRAAAGLFTVQGQRIVGADALVEEGQALADERLAALPAEPGNADEP